EERERQVPGAGFAGQGGRAAVAGVVRLEVRGEDVARQDTGGRPGPGTGARGGESSGGESRGGESDRGHHGGRRGHRGHDGGVSSHARIPLLSAKRTSQDVSRPGGDGTRPAADQEQVDRIGNFPNDSGRYSGPGSASRAAVRFGDDLAPGVP